MTEQYSSIYPHHAIEDILLVKRPDTAEHIAVRAGIKGRQTEKDNLLEWY